MEAQMMIMNRAEHRISVMKQLNAGIANLRTAEERVATADHMLIEAEEDVRGYRALYTGLHVRLEEAMCDFTVTPAQRLQLLGDINACLDHIDIVTACRAKAQSERGTAYAELTKQQEQVTALCKTLRHTLPRELLLRCSCDAFCDDPCPVHAEQNAAQNTRLAEEAVQRG
jgi:hypothetical protein